ncbi:MAG: hypothetical protein RBT51_05925 [Ectothiorhodospiraceae bacterium]|nr:hypothetical protein [Ectothiorhodospiraceae bacterium]
MTQQAELHPSIVALVSLAASIATKHPSMGLCQLRRLRDYGVPAHQIDAVIEIARHIRDEAGERLDAAFDAEAGQTSAPATASCCGTGTDGRSCC